MVTVDLFDDVTAPAEPEAPGDTQPHPTAPTGLPAGPVHDQSKSEGERLRVVAAACRVSFSWLGLTRTVKGQIKDDIAANAEADVKYLRVSKRIVKATEEPIKKLNELKGSIVKYWKGVTLPYVEPGWRLIRQDKVPEFVTKLEEFKAQLKAGVAELATHWDDLVEKAREELGQLFNESDYPTAATLEHLYSLEWDFPSVEPPSYLMDLDPKLYEQEKLRMQARFEQSVALAESAYMEEFSKLVAAMTERLTAGEGGEVKKFKNSLVGNLTEFFDSMSMLDFRNKSALDELVEKAKQLTAGVTPDELRKNGDLRNEIATQFSSISSQLEGMMVNRPKRAIIRQTKEEGK